MKKNHEKEVREWIDQKVDSLKSDIDQRIKDEDEMLREAGLSQDERDWYFYQLKCRSDELHLYTTLVMLGIA